MGYTIVSHSRGTIEKQKQDMIKYSTQQSLRNELAVLEKRIKEIKELLK